MPSQKSLTKAEEKQENIEKVGGYSDDEIFAIMQKMVTSGYDKKGILDDYREILINVAKAKTKDSKQKELQRYSDQLAENVVSLTNFEEHILVIETVSERYRSLALRMCKDLVKKYQCTGDEEIALIHQMVSAYIRSLEYSKRLIAMVNGTEWLSSERNGMMAVLSKELDRATRTYRSSLSLLMQLKQPQIKVNVRSNNAFISEKQEFNVGKAQNRDNNMKTIDANDSGK